jgi:hypothetical protein
VQALLDCANVKYGRNSALIGWLEGRLWSHYTRLAVLEREAAAKLLDGRVSTQERGAARLHSSPAPRSRRTRPPLRLVSPRKRRPGVLSLFPFGVSADERRSARRRFLVPMVARRRARHADQKPDIPAGWEAIPGGHSHARDALVVRKSD